MFAMSATKHHATTGCISFFPSCSSGIAKGEMGEGEAGHPWWHLPKSGISKINKKFRPLFVSSKT